MGCGEEFLVLFVVLAVFQVVDRVASCPRIFNLDGQQTATVHEGGVCRADGDKLPCHNMGEHYDKRGDCREEK
jgi:hypothetical protein